MRKYLALLFFVVSYFYSSAQGDFTTLLKLVGSLADKEHKR